VIEVNGRIAGGGPVPVNAPPAKGERVLGSELINFSV
jgi:hypothetical protein